MSLVVLRALTEALLVVAALPVSEVVLLEEASLEVALVLDGDMAGGSGEVLVVLVLGGECVLPAGLPAFKGSGSQSAPVDDPWGMVRVMSLVVVRCAAEGRIWRAAWTAYRFSLLWVLV